jgi:hypothetical protein
MYIELLIFLFSIWLVNEFEFDKLLQSNYQPLTKILRIMTLINVSYKRKSYSYLFVLLLYETLPKILFLYLEHYNKRSSVSGVLDIRLDTNTNSSLYIYKICIRANVNSIFENRITRIRFAKKMKRKKKRRPFRIFQLRTEWFGK